MCNIFKIQKPIPGAAQACTGLHFCTKKVSHYSALSRESIELLSVQIHEVTPTHCSPISSVNCVYCCACTFSLEWLMNYTGDGVPSPSAQNDLDDAERSMLFVCSATHKTKVWQNERVGVWG